MNKITIISKEVRHDPDLFGLKESKSKAKITINRVLN